MKFHVADNACVASGDAVEGDMVVGVVSGQFGGWLRRTSVIMVFLLSACVLLVCGRGRELLGVCLLGLPASVRTAKNFPPLRLFVTP